ncbi:MAG: MerR family DNA-binding transcriptional regulator [Candidatus Niyogibacteria bacterium CG10_big_fil_rev_8_21_14_0_10_46_36]|uniref:MerR family DNA-binding transcriptional regulator n=1 Tax=Candidatus Niyogibacteria bacterium CG10_big_fil_rev_8_21_14_0_10_46_36 TaxID=1974726 RepID=A0A2H0TCD6_9BACT|nr:MAG: MerR family DNA-binding transcriptional regulator [Candidatus Niyogibacteria bacterium CG10_big_fil_rev_8_21_14_0_10_46_36]
MTRHYLTIKQAADFIGVSALTLRNWDKKGKLAAYRHPVNGYRLYRMADLEKFVKSISGRRPRKLNIVMLEDEE